MDFPGFIWILLHHGIHIIPGHRFAHKDCILVDRFVISKSGDYIGWRIYFDPIIGSIGHHRLFICLRQLRLAHRSPGQEVIENRTDRCKEVYNKSFVVGVDNDSLVSNYPAYSLAGTQVDDPLLTIADHPHTFQRMDVLVFRHCSVSWNCAMANFSWGFVPGISRSGLCHLYGKFIAIRRFLTSNFINMQVERNGTLTDLQNTEWMQDKASDPSSSLRKETRMLFPSGSLARQLSILSNSVTRSGNTCTEGIVVFCASPQVISKSAEISISNNHRSIDKVPVPLARHGVGPSKRNFQVNTKQPNAEYFKANRE